MQATHDIRQLVEFLRQHLHLPDAAIQEEVSLGRGVRADFIVEGPNETWLIEIKNQSPNAAALGQIALYRDLLARGQSKPVRPVLVAPVISDQIQNLAERAGIETLLAPFELLPGGQPEGTPLTTERSWHVVYHILKHQRVGSIEGLAASTNVSIGWTHKVVRELANRGFVAQSRGRIELLQEERLFDAIATERPFEELRHETIDTGYDDWNTLLKLLRAQLSQLPDQKTVWGLAGTSAAAWWTGYETRHNRLDVYAPHVAGIARLFEESGGGIPLRIYKPDRGIAFTTLRGTPVAPLDVTLLDALGLGYGQRDVAIKVLEKVRQ